MERYSISQDTDNVASCYKHLFRYYLMKNSDVICKEGTTAVHVKFQTAKKGFPWQQKYDLILRSCMKRHSISQYQTFFLSLMKHLSGPFHLVQSQEGISK